MFIICFDLGLLHFSSNCIPPTLPFSLIHIQFLGRQDPELFTDSRRPCVRVQDSLQQNWHVFCYHVIQQDYS
jgi:cytochrome c biogenesis protein CcdA